MCVCVCGRVCVCVCVCGVCVCVCVCGVWVWYISYSLLTHVAIMHNLLLLGVAINEHHIVGLISLQTSPFIRPAIVLIHSADI